ncbi:MAG: valine--tRNA ligase, partial [Gammaproteobacteria bacterium]
ATTRPETMLGDTAVAVHPDDERYRHSVGKEVQLPLTGRTIPIIADEHVDPEFGSGCVKITPGHDFDDYDVGKRHDLPIINIFTSEAIVNENAPKAYVGLDRYQARKQIIADLDAQGLLEKSEDHRLMVPRCGRSGAVIEPYLTDQWYVKIGPLAQPAIEAVEKGHIKFVPANWAKTYFEWMHNIEDWCISRQLWWGHRIPAWYDEQGNIYVANSQDEARRKYQLPASTTLRQDEDVLDTWFSAALWPFSTLGWPEQTDTLRTFYPTSVLVTGFDIIFFWVARMIMMGLKFMGEVPFREVYIHGLVRDAEGQKMSKSKGNVLDPIDLIDGIDLESLVDKRTAGLMQPQMAKEIGAATRRQFPQGLPTFGTDAIRFTFCALATTGRDIKFDLNRVQGYRNFCNKLWNAARYALTNTQDQDTGAHGRAVELSLADRWIISRLQTVERDVNDYLDGYRFDLVAQALYDFTWHDYCDWYLELSKPVLQSDTTPAEIKRGTRRTLVRVLEALLRLLHPLMPFITEEIWQQTAPIAGKQGETIQLQPFPQADESKIDAAATEELEWVKAFIMGVRRIRSERDIAPGKSLPVTVQNWSEQDEQRYAGNRESITKLAKIDSVVWLNSEPAPEAAVALLGDMKILVPLAGLIDKDAELRRIEKELESLAGNLKKCQTKLDNPSFVERAPAHIVAQERKRVDDMQAALSQLEAEAERLRGL